MRVLSWNCRVLRGSLTVRELERLVKTQNPSLVFLSETKLETGSFEKIRMKLAMFGVCVDAIGKKGGLALLWKKDLDVKLLKYSEDFIDISIKKEACCWRMTGIYGRPDAQLRYKIWNLMRKLANSNHDPWVCIGDFNEVLHSGECRGEWRRPWRQISKFRDVVNEIGLMDIPSYGYPYTWARNWKRASSYRAKLDRAMVNSKLKGIWQNPRTLHLDTNYSDHLPILLLLNSDYGSTNARRTNKSKRFRFEAMWIPNQEVKNVIKDAWTKYSPELMDKLKNCRKSIQVWKKKFGNIFQEADKIRDKITELKFKEDNDENEGEIERLQDELNLRLDQQEKHWQQRSKALWLKSGDKNTSYFHNVASRRRKMNTIMALKDDDGNWVEDQDKLKLMIVQYFSELFTSGRIHNELSLEILGRMNVQMTPADFQIMDNDYKSEEVRQAVFGMHPMKAPGPDGLNPQFFQAYWDIVGPDLTSSILQMLKQRRISNEKIQGIQVGRGGPRISHLMFADDTILFGVATVEEAKTFAEILNIYSKISGQKEVSKHDKYLGLPTVIGKSKQQLFASLKERILNRLNGWEKKQLSRAGTKISWMLLLLQTLLSRGGVFWQLGTPSRRAYYGVLGMVKGIPLGDPSVEDFPFWPHTKNGVYSVRSGYHYIHQKRMEPVLSASTSSNMAHQQKIWRKIWKLKVANKFWHEYREANRCLASPERTEREDKWFPPPEPHWKINVYASCDKHGNNGLGMIVRDSYGNFIYAEAKTVPFWDDISVLEAYAIKEACEWCKERNLRNIFIETDAQGIVKMIKEETDNRTSSRIFVEEVKKIIKEGKHTICWVSRNANNVAHTLASFARISKGMHLWPASPPDFLTEVLKEDQ